MRFKSVAAALLLGLGAMPMTAIAQTSPPPGPPPGFVPPKRIAIQPEPGAIPLYSGVAPGSESWKQKEVWTGMGNQVWIRNVTRPTLTPFLPKKGKATGAAVLVVPGGGFRFVSASSEGWGVARWFAERGVAAFVLKYRTMETPDFEGEFMASMSRLFAPRTTSYEVPPDMTAATDIASADAQVALRMIRANAGKWGVDSKRLGMIGFSAGAMTTIRTTLLDASDARPDFVAPIYGSMRAVTPPKNPQPLFVALASDDPLFNKEGFGLIESWQEAGGPVELHYYANGGHGFGSQTQGTTSDLWFNQFMSWMKAKGLLKAKP